MPKQETGLGKQIYNGVFAAAFILAAVDIVAHSPDAFAWAAKGGQDFCANPVTVAACAIVKPVAVPINNITKPVLQTFDQTPVPHILEITGEFIDSLFGGKK